MQDPLAVGAQAPAFSADAIDGRRYSLSEQLAQGPVALFFYPGNDTPG